MELKLAYFGLPHTGGTYSVFKFLKEGLSNQGILVEWVGLCNEMHKKELQKEYSQEFKYGNCLIADDNDDLTSLKKLYNYIIKEKYDGVIANVLSNKLQTSVVKYLPGNLKRIMIVHSISPGTYNEAKKYRDYVNAVVGVSKRIKRDLISKYSFNENKTFTINNAYIPPKNLSNISSQMYSAKILSLGRIEDTSKGVFWLSKLMEYLPPEFTLTIAGDGPDLAELKRKLTQYNERVIFTGKIPHNEVHNVFSEHDFFIMPSRFEGFGISLLEAMATGCIPVVSNIKGVTDQVISDKNNGFLFPVGNMKSAAEKIKFAHENPRIIKQIKNNIPKDLNEYSVKNVTEQYLNIIEMVFKNGWEMKTLCLENWKPESEIINNLRASIPESFKNLVRKYRERRV